MTFSSSTHTSWSRNQTDDNLMAAAHVPYWRHFMDCVVQGDLRDSCVMDFGCHQGDFLRLLYETHPFRQGIGVDPAGACIAVANQNKGSRPIQYEATDDISSYVNVVDLAVSYEVIYLVPDLAMHAADLFLALKPGGVYYALTAYHTESPMLQHWKETIPKRCYATLFDRSPEEYVDAFSAAGFEVGVRRFGYSGFVQTAKARSFYPKVTEAIDNHAFHKLIFRMEKPGL